MFVFARVRFYYREVSFVIQYNLHTLQEPVDRPKQFMLDWVTSRRPFL